MVLFLPEDVYTKISKLSDVVENNRKRGEREMEGYFVHQGVNDTPKLFGSPKEAK